MNLPPSYDSPPPYDSRTQHTKVYCSLCRRSVNKRQRNKQYPLCAGCNSHYSSMGYLFRSVWLMSKHNSQDFKNKFLELFFKELEEDNWLCGNPDMSVKALYQYIFYKYTTFTSSDLTFVKAEKKRMKGCMDEWNKSVLQEKQRIDECMAN